MDCSSEIQKGLLQSTIHLKKCLDEFAPKSNKVWADQSSEFYNRSLKSWLHDSGIELYSTHNERKSVVAERFIRSFNDKIYKHMNTISKICKLTG